MEDSYEFTLRLLCPSVNTRDVIGMAGATINQIREESGATINLDCCFDDEDCMFVGISNSPTINAATHLQPSCSRKLECGCEGPSYVTRLLVLRSQVGGLIGKGGFVIKEMRRTTQASISIVENSLPSVASVDDALVQDGLFSFSIFLNTSGVNNTQVVAHKRKALLLKQEGKLAEAKEELKQAKILEKQLEEQEFLVEALDSEDELYTLIQNMGNENQDDLMLENDLDVGANFEHFLSASDDLPIDDNLEVTEHDMNDPEIGDALRLFGWSEQDDQHEQRDASESVPFDQEGLQAKILNLKKEVLSQKWAENAPEAMALLKKAKLLEQDLGTFQSDTNMPEPKFSQGTQEAEEELKKGKVLEQQLEELENTSKKHVNIPTQKRMEPTHVQDSAIGTFDIGVDSAEIDVTEQDMHDPAMLSAL
ncbi:KH domain-containing protein [Dendrobium catenatum]|uniref:KH domain-containing protein n=1 Tax=Dendrobium catenatum TaxID=906689 RepID=A0A2I0WE79_9ASPA|nr:KH domain-containing protein [Dendrobium catenatum]